MAHVSYDRFSKGCHVNFSLWQDGSNLFFSSKEKPRSPALEHVVAGILATFSEFTLLYAPTPNSFRRFAPYRWTGMNAAWALDNKSVALRVVNETHDSARLEQRAAGAAVNPYIAIAAVMAAGRYGLENQLHPPSPVCGDAYVNDEVSSLPQDMASALALFRKSRVAREYLGEDFVRFYAHTREAELCLFNDQDNEPRDSRLTDWELKRYFELI